MECIRGRHECGRNSRQNDWGFPIAELALWNGQLSVADKEVKMDIRSDIIPPAAEFPKKSRAFVSCRRNWSIDLTRVRLGLLNWIILGCKLLRGPSTKQFFSL